MQRADLHTRAAAAVASLQQQLVCPGCARPFTKGRPWRSTQCEHTICAACAAIARGRLGQRASQRVQAAAGKCPVAHCAVPIRPAELVEDVAIRAVIDASARLSDWAAEAALANTMVAAFLHSLSPSRALFRDVLKLSKYRLSALVAFTAGSGYVARYDGEDARYWRELGAVTAGTWLTAACANTLNQMYEIRSDARMARTRLRPLPAGRIGVIGAGLYAACTGVTGLALLQQETNHTATALAAANIALYAGVYTPLKPISTVNTWIGSVVGAIPPMLGWAAASDGKLSGQRELGAWGLGALLFLWQIPHFHALAVMARADYAAGGLKMLAVSNPVLNATWARVTAAMLLPIGAVMTKSGVTSEPFSWEMAAMGWWMWRGSAVMANMPTAVSAAKPLFRASIVYLPVSLGLLMLHRVPYGVQTEQRQQGGEVRLHQPWEVMAPFPFLPVPMGAPAVVLETER